MQEEMYTRWQPHRKLNSQPIVERIFDDDTGLNVLLKLVDERESQLLLRFESSVAYRNINESYRLRTWNRINSERWDGGCYILENSKFVAWLKKEAGGILDDISLIHYCIFTDEDCIDVVTEFQPVVEIQ